MYYYAIFIIGNILILEEAIPLKKIKIIILKSKKGRRIKNMGSSNFSGNENKVFFLLFLCHNYITILIS